MDDTLAQLFGVSPDATTGNIFTSLAKGNQTVSNASLPSMASLSLGGGAPTAGGGSSYQAPQTQMPQMAAPAPVGPTQAAAMGQQPANPINQAPAQAVAPQAQQMSMPQGQGTPSPMQIPNAAPVAPQQQWSDINPGAPLVGGGNANAQGMVPTAPVNPQTAQQPQGAIPGQPAPQAGGQTTNNVTPQDLLGNNIFNNMLNTESGNQNFNPDGTPVTSGAGAKYAAQVMPATAAHPGFGIRPAANDSPEEYNRVGKEYHQKMRERYNDEEKAVAAYNAGPGRVDHAVAVANQTGRDWKEYLPQETKDYLRKVNPTGVVAQQAQQAQLMKTGANVGNAQEGQMGPNGMTGNADHDALISAGNNINKLNELATNPNTDPAVRQAAYQTINDISSNAIGKDRTMKQMTENANNGNTLANTRMMQDKGPQGNMARALFYELVGAHSAAANEYNKLGVGAQWVAGMGPDGQMMTVKQGADGRALAVIDPSTGEHITDPRELERYNGSGMAGKGSTTEGSVGYDKEGTAYSRTILPNGRGMMFTNLKTGQRTMTAPEGYTNTPYSPEYKARTSVAAQIEKSMRKDNADAARTNSTAPHTEQQIQDQKNLILSGAPATYKAPATSTAPQISSDNQAAAANGTTPVAPTATTPAPTPVATGNWATPEANDLARRNPTAEAIASYKSAPPSASTKGGAGSAALMNDVRKINPDYNEQKFKEAQLARNDYSKVSPQSAGGQLQAVNRAIPHMDQLEKASKALENGNMPMVNGILNQYGFNVGDDKAAAAKALQGLVSSEVQKAVTGGLGGVGEREELKSQLSSNLNPKQLARVIHDYQGLMVTQAEGLKQNWTSHGLSGKEWDEKLVPRAREVVEQHHKEQNNTRGAW